MALGSILHGMFPLIYHLCPYLNRVLEDMPFLAGEWGKGWAAFPACFLPVEIGPRMIKKRPDPQLRLGVVLEVVFLSIWYESDPLANNYILNSLRCVFFSRLLYSYLELLGLCMTTSLVFSCGEFPSKSFCLTGKCLLGERKTLVSFAHYSPNTFVLQVCVSFSIPSNFLWASTGCPTI